MKKYIYSALLGVSFLLATGCASKLPTVSESQLQSSDSKNLSYNGKTYELVQNLEFNDDSNIFEFANISSEVKSENIYVKDGILHAVPSVSSTKWGFAMHWPILISKQLIERKSIVEIKYKLPEKFYGSCCSICFVEPYLLRWKGNGQGWDFTSFHLCEIRTNPNGLVNFYSSMWLGKQKEPFNVPWEDIEFECPDYQSNWDYDIPENYYDENKYSFDDETAFQWHTLRVFYDDTSLTVYNDDIKTYEWNWNEHSEYGLPCDGSLLYYYDEYSSLLGPRELTIEYAITSDWISNKNLQWEFIVRNAPNLRSGPYDLQIDYIKVWETK